MHSSMVAKGLKFFVALKPGLLSSWQMSLLDFFTAGAASAAFAAGAAAIAGFEGVVAAGATAGAAAGAVAVTGLAGAGVAVV